MSLKPVQESLKQDSLYFSFTFQILIVCHFKPDNRSIAKNLTEKTVSIAGLSHFNLQEIHLLAIPCYFYIQRAP